MSSYAIPIDWTADDLIEALLPPVAVLQNLTKCEDRWITDDVECWIERVEALRHSSQAGIDWMLEN
ncbi:MAG: hypothetical protein WBO46_01765 [Caldilineaceae bacterium]